MTRTSRKAKALASDTGAPPIAGTTSDKGASAGKVGVLIWMLQRPQGATIAELVEETGWQAHSVRGAISGTLKKQKGLTVSSEKADGVRTYRITGATPA